MPIETDISGICRMLSIDGDIGGPQRINHFHTFNISTTPRWTWKYILSNGMSLQEQQLSHKIITGELIIKNIELFMWLIPLREAYYKRYAKEIYYDYEDIYRIINKEANKRGGVPKEIRVELVNNADIRTVILKSVITSANCTEIKDESGEVQGAILVMSRDESLTIRILAKGKINICSYRSERQPDFNFTAKSHNEVQHYTCDISRVDCSEIISPMELFPIRTQGSMQLDLIVNDTFKADSIINRMFSNKMDKVNIIHA